jgi:hypothetical protein
VLSRRPALVVAVCVLVLLEAALFAGLGVAYLVDAVRGATDLVGATVFLALFFVAIAALLVLCVRGLWRGRRWARSPVVTWQVLLLVLALAAMSSGVSTLVSVGILVLAGAILIGLFLPSVHAATSGRSAPAGES